MKYHLSADEKKVRLLTASTLLFSTAITFLQIHDAHGGLFGFHITSIGMEHLLLVMLLAIGATLILAQGLFRGRRLAHRCVLILSLIFGFGALLTGPTFGTVVDTILCATLLFVLINYSFAFNIQPDVPRLRRNLIIGIGITVGLWLFGARTMAVMSFEPLSLGETLRRSSLWLLGQPLDGLARLTSISESLLSIMLVVWVIYLLRTLFVIIMSADDFTIVRNERAWIRRLLLRPTQRRKQTVRS